MLKILIAEDDLMIADIVKDVLIEYGYEVCGVAHTVVDAVALGLRHRPDLAVIDLRLANGGLGNEVAAQLGALDRLGVLYATGDVSHVMLNAADGDACLSKPYSTSDLLRSLEVVAGMVATGTASPPFPRGFQVLSMATAARRETMHG